MDHYDQEIELYFELKGTPASSRESYFRRVNAFINYLIDRHKRAEDITDVFVNQKGDHLTNKKGTTP